MDPTTVFRTLLAAVPGRYLVDVAALCGVCAAVMPWLPVPGRAGSAYGRLYVVLNVVAQNFRNVTNMVQPGQVSASRPGSAPGAEGGRRLPPLGLALLLGGGMALSGCTAGTGGVRIDTAELNADAGAIAFAAQAIESVPALSSHLSADQVAEVNAALTRIKEITAQINAASGGTIDIQTGKDWASSLASEFQTILTIAAPVVSAFAPGVGTYIQTAEQIIPLIEAAVGLAPASMAGVGGARPGGGDAPALRAALYRGVA
ncbi:hypothetical protein HLH33_11205 [Gluconacetobacter diazotrophicus]|uniref:Uncharacterized protein n=1 Tax=Gluconacetobacter diazotrophicus TaxID=33996 RepID=A0A7W4NM88_GLUDI|nr:hypothetical protein [Gluconacetobacter diazotrophicus]MBB2156870.1 hypothetical protein [Gluconacetobacter diazotrophicus]